MAINYKLDLLNQKMLNGILQPLLRNENLKYFKLAAWDVSTYLQCLATILTLCECKMLETDSNIFHVKSIQYLIGMSIKHGNTGKLSENRFQNFLIKISLHFLWIFQSNVR